MIRFVMITFVMDNFLDSDVRDVDLFSGGRVIQFLARPGDTILLTSCLTDVGFRQFVLDNFRPYTQGDKILVDLWSRVTRLVTIF